MNEEIKNDIKANKRTALLAGVALILLLSAAWLYKLNMDKNETGINNQNNISENNTDNQDGTATEDNDSPSPTEILDQQINLNPNNPNLYAEKSDILYNSGDKAGALDAVNEGLAENPDSDLLKNKKDVLEKDFFQSSSADAPRQ